MLFMMTRNAAKHPKFKKTKGTKVSSNASQEGKATLRDLPMHQKNPTNLRPAQQSRFTPQAKQQPNNDHTLNDIPGNVVSSENEVLSATNNTPIAVDLDREDQCNPLMAAEYATEIFQYLRNLEAEYTPNPHYISQQKDFGWKTRSMVVDWLIEIHGRLELLPDTLFLAVNIIDRFLSVKVVRLQRLPLLSITALLIAAKYEEIRSSKITDFKYATSDYAFSEAEVFSAERVILRTLDYKLSYPNPMDFLRRIATVYGNNIEVLTKAMYLTETSLLDYQLFRYRPSYIAAAAMSLARLMLDQGEWVSYV